MVLLSVCRGRRLRRQAPPTKWELQQPGLYVRLLWAKVTQRNLAMGSSARCRVKRYASRSDFLSNAAMGKSTQPWGNTTRSTGSQCDFWIDVSDVFSSFLWRFQVKDRTKQHTVFHHLIRLRSLLYAACSIYINGKDLYIKKHCQNREISRLDVAPKIRHSTSKIQVMILLMEELLHHLGRLFHYLHGFTHPRWCRSSSINSDNQHLTVGENRLTSWYVSPIENFEIPTPALPFLLLLLLLCLWLLFWLLLSWFSIHQTSPSIKPLENLQPFP